MQVPGAKLHDLVARKLKAEPPHFSYSLVITAPPARVLRAFFDPQDLAAWWETSRSVTTPGVLGVYAVQWETGDYQDELLGPLGGTLHGTVADYGPAHEFLLADVYWIPPSGEPIGPMALEVACKAHGPVPEAPNQATLLRVSQRGYEESARWARYYDVIAGGWQHSLWTLKRYLERA